jgi:hypothetical protein
VTVNPNDCAIEHCIFKIVIASQGLENSVKGVGFDPPAEPFKNRIPLSKIRRQITPWRTRSSDPQNRFNKKPWLRPCASNVCFFAKAMRRYRMPLSIG